MILETISVGPLEVNCYILAAAKNGRAIIIDPGSDEREIRKALSEYNLTPACVINTHGHYDHIGCDDAFGVAIYAHRKEEPLLRDANLNFSSMFARSLQVRSEIKFLEDGQVIAEGQIELKVLHTPGHSPGGVCLLLMKPKDNIIFTGDTLFHQGIGRTDFPGGDEGQLINSIKEKLLVLDDAVICLPGHGGSTTIGKERKSNPYLS